MAYVVPGQDEDEQQQAPQQAMPKLGGSSSFGGGSAGSAPLQQGVAPATAPKSNPAQKGTGFTNLNNWLDAGKGRDQAITNKGTGLLNEEKGTFDNAANPLRNASFTADTENVQGLFDSGDDAKLTGMLNQQNTAPRDVNYDANAQKNLWDADSLSNANTVGSVLARPQIEQGSYTSGMQRLDNVLFGADGASQDASKQVGSSLGTFKSDVDKEKTALGEKVTRLDGEAQYARDKVRGELEGIGSKLNVDIMGRVGAANSDELKAFNGSPEIPAGQVKGEWQAGSGVVGQGANKGNIGTDAEISGLNRLASLLGDDSLKVQDTGDFKSGAWGTKADGVPEAEKYVPTFQEQLSFLTEQDPTGALNQQFTTRYNAIRAAYPNRPLTATEHAEIMNEIRAQMPMFGGGDAYSDSKWNDQSGRIETGPPKKWENKGTKSTTAQQKTQKKK